MRILLSLAVLIIAGCSSGGSNHAANRQDNSYEPPFYYYGLKLKFPIGTVDSRTENEPWARLLPDSPKSGDAIDARYYIDLGRKGTGTAGAMGYWLGAGSYKSDERVSDLGNNYELYCNKHNHDPLPFTCAVLLRALPLAAIQFRDRPSSPEAARKMVLEAEVFLLKAKGQDFRPIGDAQNIGQAR